ncbi:MAG TPA: 50S ribosomal protein L4 [Candidatus Nanoarchaeia archaeon]|nr:50S ribosomal protein L4 [Candidatus Nanoarchaeia archaeon]
MKTKVLDLQGKEKGSITLPEFFSEKIREDIVSRVLEAKKIKQPYGPSPMAGKQYSASGILIHKRKVWKSQYGRGMSRVPRKIMMSRGEQFNWEGATSPNTKGGRRSHPPRPEGMKNKLKINKKELKTAIKSALSATANQEKISEKYGRLKDKKVDAPFVVDSKITQEKTKNILESFKKILGDEVYQVVEKKKKTRPGRGKLRGRRYKTNAGLLLVIGNNEKLKSKRFEIKKAENLGINDLAKGGMGRLTIYTEKAIEDLKNRFENNPEENKSKGSKK